jgi:hypothetical protein
MKFVPSVSNLYDYWGGKRLSQLLALFVALAALGPTAAPAQSADHIVVMPADLKWAEIDSPKAENGGGSEEKSRPRMPSRRKMSALLDT